MTTFAQVQGFLMFASMPKVLAAVEAILETPLPDPDDVGGNDVEDPRLNRSLSLRSALRVHETEVVEQEQLPVRRAFVAFATTPDHVTPTLTLTLTPPPASL